MPTSKPKAIGYAEDVLGVHALYAEAQEVLKSLQDAHGELASAKAEKRSTEQAIRQYETEVAEEVYRTNSEASMASIERITKRLIATDNRLESLRNGLAEVVSQVEATEYLVRNLTIEAQLLTARMNEIGGYLQFLAAAKLAQIADLHQKNQSSQES